MATAQTYSMETILKVRELLRKLPVKKEGKPRSEVVGFLVRDFQKAAKKGYGLKEIQAILSEGGIRVSLASLTAAVENSKGKRMEMEGATGRDAGQADAQTALPKNDSSGTSSPVVSSEVGEKAPATLEDTAPEKMPLRLETRDAWVYVVGQTKKYRDRLRMIRDCRWDAENLAWVFPAGGEAEARRLLQDLLEPEQK